MMVAMLKMMKILIMIAKLNSDDEENDADCNVENYEKIDYDCNVEDYEENDYDCNGKMMKRMTLIAMLKSAKSFFFMMSLKTKSIIFLKAKKLEQKKDFFSRDDSVKATVDEPMQIDNNGASVCRRKLLHFV